MRQHGNTPWTILTTDLYFININKKGVFRGQARIVTSYVFYLPQVWQLWGIPAWEAEKGGVPTGLWEAGVWKGRAEREAKAESNSEWAETTVISFPLSPRFLLCVWLYVFPAAADKSLHVVAAVAHVQIPANTLHTDLLQTHTHTHYLGGPSLQPSAMCHSVSLLKEYIQSEFLNDSGDRLFLFISGLCIFNGFVSWKHCRLLLITPQG